jgi:hypothetical protein
MSDRTDSHSEQHDLDGTTTPSATYPTVDTLAYPISPDYVRSWTPVRALCELIANALDEDRSARVSWAEGVLTVADNGPGIPEEGLILGYSTKTDQQIGQFGEGKKLACLVLARSTDIGAVRCETVGYGFVPTVERRRLLAGLIPSRSAQGAEVLVYHLAQNARARGTVITVECPKALADEAIGRFRALTEPGYISPGVPGACVLTGTPGRVWIGGVLVTTVQGFHASYDLPLDSKTLQNRDRTVIEAGALRDAVRTILAASEDPAVVDRFASHVLAGGSLREPEQFFAGVTHPRARVVWRTWGRAHLPAQTFYTLDAAESALDLRDKGFTEVSARELPANHQRALMDLLGVEVVRVSQRRHYEENRDKTTWVSERSLTAAERTALRDGCQLVRRAIGPYALDRVRVYSESEESPCSAGFYNPRNGDTAVHRDTLSDRHVLFSTLLHEAAHRVGHRGGGRWTPIPDYSDRSRGFESMLSDFGGLLLGYLADGGSLPEPVEGADRAATAGGRLSGADDPAVPVSRRELARLLTDRLPHALTTGGYTSEKDMVASTAVHPEYWRTLTSSPRPAGYRRKMGAGGRAWDYDKVALLAAAAAVGVHPPVVWLGYNLCEGPLHGRQRERWGQPGPWTKRIRDLTLRACAELQALGGAYADQIPALHALVNGQTPAPTGDDSWQAPVRALIGLERQRLGLDQRPAA